MSSEDEPSWETGSNPDKHDGRTPYTHASVPSTPKVRVTPTQHSPKPAVADKQINPVTLDELVARDWKSLPRTWHVEPILLTPAAIAYLKKSKIPFVILADDEAHLRYRLNEFSPDEVKKVKSGRIALSPRLRPIYQSTHESLPVLLEDSPRIFYLSRYEVTEDFLKSYIPQMNRLAYRPPPETIAAT